MTYHNFALLIGNGDYQKDPGSFPPLPTSIEDVKELARTLSTPPRGIFQNIQTIIDQENSVILTKIEELVNQLSKEDLLLLYFSGHAKKDEFGKLHLAVKNSKSRLKTSMISITTLNEILAGCESQRLIIVLDCCHSGAAIPGLVKGEEDKDLKEIVKSGTGRYIITSSSSSEQSWVDKENRMSIFTKYLIEGIDTETADTDGDGFITADEWYDYAKKKTEVHPQKSEQKPTLSKIRSKGRLVIARTSKQHISAERRGRDMPIIAGPILETIEVEDYDNTYQYETIHLISAWNLVGYKSKCSIAVIAGRIELDHPALANIPITFQSIAAPSLPPDNFTMAIMGLIAAPSIGVVPGCKILLIDALENEGIIKMSSLIVAMDKAREAGVDVICLPWAIEEELVKDHPVMIMIDTLTEDGIAIICDSGGNSNDKKVYPACHPSAIAAYSIDQHDYKTPWSNFGDWMDVGAPGENMVSCKTGHSYQKFAMSGISCAIVTGVVALMLTANPDLTPAEIAKLLRISSDNIDDLNPRFAGKLGGGRINAHNAVLAALRAKMQKQ